MTALGLQWLFVSPLWEGAALVLGLIVGSFSNVCIHRLPLRQSVVTPASRCPACRGLIKPWDNIPLLSFLLLGGRCRCCRAPISRRYPAVELANGLLYLGLASSYGPRPATLVKMALASALVILAFVDFDEQILPDAVTLPGLAFGLASSLLFAPSGGGRSLVLCGGFAAMLFVGMLSGWDPGRVSTLELSRDAGAVDGLAVARQIDWKLAAMLGVFVAWQRLVLGSWSEAALAALLAYLMMALVAALSAAYYRQHALGQGDWKMAAMLGAFLSWRGVLLALFLGTLLGAIFGLALVLLKRGSGRTRVPLGTFLALGALVTLFFGGPLLAWYGRLPALYLKLLRD